jgi:hypothetical protein
MGQKKQTGTVFVRSIENYQATETDFYLNQIIDLPFFIITKPHSNHEKNCFYFAAVQRYVVFGLLRKGYQPL